MSMVARSKFTSPLPDGSRHQMRCRGCFQGHLRTRVRAYITRQYPLFFSRRIRSNRNNSLLAAPCLNHASKHTQTSPTSWRCQVWSFETLSSLNIQTNSLCRLCGRFLSIFFRELCFHTRHRVEWKGSPVNPGVCQLLIGHVQGHVCCCWSGSCDNHCSVKIFKHFCSPFALSEI